MLIRPRTRFNKMVSHSLGRQGCLGVLRYWYARLVNWKRKLAQEFIDPSGLEDKWNFPLLVLEDSNIIL